VDANSPANARASQSNRSEKNSALDAFVSQKTETKERQYGGRKGHDRAVNCARERNACPEPIDTGKVEWQVHTIELINAACSRPTTIQQKARIRQ
jgi:hypothetical protein